MPFTFTSGTATVGVTEFSLARNANYSSGTPVTTQGMVYAFADLSAMVAGDVYRLRIYERCNGGTQAPIFEAVATGAQSQLYAFPVQLLGDGWDVTATKVAGTDRSLRFSVRQDTNDVNAATLGATAIASAVAALVAPTAAAVMASVVETGAAIVGGTIDLAGTLRVLLAKAAFLSSGYLTGSVAFRNAANTKNRITGTSTPGGTGRTASSIDPA